MTASSVSLRRRAQSRRAPLASFPAAKHQDLNEPSRPAGKSELLLPEWEWLRTRGPGEPKLMPNAFAISRPSLQKLPPVWLPVLLPVDDLPQAVRRQDSKDTRVARPEFESPTNQQLSFSKRLLMKCNQPRKVPCVCMLRILLQNPRIDSGSRSNVS